MKRLSFPLDVQIELTEACNQRCLHCYNYWRYDYKTIKKDELMVNDFLILLSKLNDCGVSMITLTGGEPLLRPDVFFALLKQGKKYGMEVGLNSNAVLITKEMANKMYEYGLDHALISLLGLEDTHNRISSLSNGFKNTCNGIKNLLEAKIPVVVNMVASKISHNDIYQLGSFIKELGVEKFCVTPMVPSHETHFQYVLNGEECKSALRTLLKTGKDFNLKIDTLEPIARCLFKPEEEDEFISFFGNRICSASVSSCAISSKGNVRPCIHADQEFGNLLKEDLSLIWEKMSFWSSCEILPKECLECNANVICEGGCRMSAKLINGSYNNKDMYMTEPIMDFSRINKLPQRNTELNFFEHTILKANDEIKFRKEIFGWVVYVHNNIEFCTDEGYNFIRNLSKKSSFTTTDLINEFGIEKGILVPVMEKLIRNKLIVIV